MRKYSVLLLYPESIANTYGESYYTMVEAESPTEAVTVAKRELVEVNLEGCEDAEEKRVLQHLWEDSEITCLLLMLGHQECL